MFILSHPWILLLLPLPVVLRFIIPPHHESRKAIQIPWFTRIVTMYNLTPAKGAVVVQNSKLQTVCIWLAWFLIVLALARPQYLDPPVEQVIPTRDILLLVDLSGSMETRDFSNADGEKVDRLTTVKEVLDDFLTKRKGDRVGLVVFGNAAFVQVPFTQDLEACRLLLSEMAVRMAGPRTAFGDSIGLGITLFQRSKVKDRVMIALTDGNDTGSKVEPVEAARIAKDNGVIVHVIGVGNPESVGEEKFDEQQLQAVADASNGRYFYAADRKQLAEVYTELDTINSHKVETRSYRPRLDLFHWPLALFILICLLRHGVLLLGKLYRKGEA